MAPSWLIPLATFIFGSAGIGTILGFLVQRKNVKLTATATAVSQAIDGLRILNDARGAELERVYRVLAERDARIAILEANEANMKKRQRGQT